MSLYHFKAFACIEFVAFGSRQISLVEHSRSNFCSFVFICLCVGEDVPRPSDDADEGYQWEIQTDEG
jgi:hypothetical protein